ncbi:MAG: hypothetical protein AVDCRST_MAG01-01-224 [uncultured Rubrobacteraceae bacterium]|uniref:Uncharacterized protein n=2 Tax=Actinomycetota TaxID=201174 RepID=A0A6J4NDT7_9ACTN|nr:MAG: hypothetical protein AVDCRST_MAG21-1289 [uncultured Nocardioidaceae bacterium]CAA9385620.1 MAG: hypothetical protein AVDCRST_MAG01-01-224 [uncultured Rubrobacteraceae bacterium]
MCSEPLAEKWEGSTQGASPPDPEERYRDERVRLPAEEGARLVFLRGVIDEGTSRGWKMVSVAKQQGADVLLVTWDTQGPILG